MVFECKKIVNGILKDLVECLGSEQPVAVCRCSKGFRSITGHGHFHCRHCREPFRYRVQLFGHEGQVHGKTKLDDEDTVLQDNNTSREVLDESALQLQPASASEIESHDESPAKSQSDDHQSSSTNVNKSVDELSASSQTGDICHQANQPCEAAPDICASGKQNRQSDQSNNANTKSDSQNYATRVTIWAGGRRAVSQVPCYSGNMVPDKRGRKVRCPICGQLFVRMATFRNHIICVHNIIHAGDTVYSCVPCRYETTYDSSFNSHLESLLHRSNLKASSSWFYTSTRYQSFKPTEVGFMKPEPRVVWYSQKNHLCSSQCLSGLNVQPPSAADETDGTSQAAEPQKSLDEPAASVQTAAASGDDDKESRRLRSSDARVRKKVTTRKSTTPLVVAFSFTDKKKGTVGVNKVSTTTGAPGPESCDKKEEAAEGKKASKPTKTSGTESCNDKAKTSLFEKVVTISDSDSEENATVNVPVETQSSESNKQQTSSGATEPSLSSESVNAGSYLKASTSESTSVAGSHRTETSSASCPAPNGSTSVASTSQQNSRKLATSTAPRTPVTTVRQVHTSSIPVISPVTAGDTVSAVSVGSSSAAVRSVPVIGVAKGVPAVTTVTHTSTTMSSRSMYSLHRFSAETLWSELCRRGSMRSCDCGISFMDSALYLLHRSCHSDLGALKCAFCDHKADTTYDFHAHLLDHKK